MSSAAASLPCSGRATKFRDNDSHHNSEDPCPKEIPDIRTITDQWMKKFGSLIARPDTPEPIADPKLLLKENSSISIDTDNTNGV